MTIELDIQKYYSQLQISETEGKQFYLDPIRKKKVVAQPEELIRQLLILYFINECNYPLSRIQVEKTLTINGQQKRFDILIYDWNIKPFMVIECKSFKININQKVADQAAIYNMKIGAPYLVVSNGSTSYCCDVSSDTGIIHFLDMLPSFPKK